MPAPITHRKRGAAKTRASATDRLFMALDHYRLGDSPDGPLVEVLGIHQIPGGGAWVQIAVAGEPRDGAIVHLPHRATAAQALAALEAWGAAPPEGRPRVIRVMRLA